MGTVAATLLYRVCNIIIPILGLAFVLSVPQRLGTPILIEELLGVLLGLATAAVFIKFPFRRQAGWIELLLALVALACWVYMSVHYEDWLIDAANRSLVKWLPACLGIGLLLLGVWRSCGAPIALLFGGFIVYGLFGQYLPGTLQAFEQPPAKVAIYLFADSNGIPGSVLHVICTIVLVFVVFGKLLELTGASRFFTDLAMALLGHRRGGPAKVAILASAAFGSINGTTVGNIISTGVVTIPLMKRNGYRPQDAAAIEAVASNGGQLAPPIMGATAFLIAEFLQIDYADVVIAATIPAALYFLGLFIQVDAMAKRQGLRGLPKSELPRAGAVLRSGWIYLAPLAILIYLMIGLGFDPAVAGLYASGGLLVLALLKFRRPPSGVAVQDAIVGSGENVLPLIMIGGGAGIAIGVLNISGLGFQLANSLAGLAETSGLLVMLLVTAVVCIILGMGMPTSAVYIVLSIVLAPSIVRAGVEPLAAHLFLFYFGLLSMLTPPVAVASYVAASMANSGMWATGLAGLRLASVGFFVPFLWVYNPALIASGSTVQVVYASLSAVAASILLAQALAGIEGGRMVRTAYWICGIAGAIVVGSSTLWLGTASPAVPLLSVAALAAAWLLGRRQSREGAAASATPAVRGEVSGAGGRSL